MKEFKLIVAGGRDFTDYAASDAINELANDTLSPYIDQEDVPEWAIAQLIAELKEIER